MCQFCHQHGEGKKWYLEARNYSEELLSDITRRRYILHFIKFPDVVSEKKPRGFMKEFNETCEAARTFFGPEVDSFCVPNSPSPTASAPAIAERASSAMER